MRRKPAPRRRMLVSPRGGERAVEEPRRVPPAVRRVQQHREHAHAVALGQGDEAVTGAFRMPGLQAYCALVAADQRVGITQREYPALKRLERNFFRPRKTHVLAML